MDVRVEPWRMMSTEEMMFSNCVLEKTLESPLGSKEIKPVTPKGNQLWIFIGRTDNESEAPLFLPPDVMNQLIRKDTYAGKDWRQEEKGIIEDEMVGWHHQLSGLEFGQAPGDSEDREVKTCFIAIHTVVKGCTQLSNWTATTTCLFVCMCVNIKVPAVKYSWGSLGYI